MKKLVICALSALTILSSSAAFAQGWRGPGPFFGGFAAGAIIGGAVAFSYYHPYYGPVVVQQPVYIQPVPQVVYTQPAPVVIQQQAQVAVNQQPQAYYCPANGNFYPTVKTCDGGWQVQ